MSRMSRMGNRIIRDIRGSFLDDLNVCDERRSHAR
jgi:hypothetical protein